MAARWGEPRTFRGGEHTIRAVPKLNGDIIETLVIVHMDGNQRDVEKMSQDIKNLYIGSSYSAAWVLGGTNE